MKTTTILLNIVEQLKQINNVTNVEINAHYAEDEDTICHKVVAYGNYYCENKHIYFYVVVLNCDKKYNYEIQSTSNRYEAKYMFKTHIF